MNPVGGNVQFFQTNELGYQSEDQVCIIHSWKLENDLVDLVLVGDNLKYKITYSTGEVYFGPIIIPDDLPVQEAINQLISFSVEIIADENIVRFVPKNTRSSSNDEDYKEESAERIESTYSRLDNASVIDHENWAVTLVDSFKCDPNVFTGGFQTWGGHAALFIEAVKDGKYHMYRAHLISSDTKGKGRVEYEEMKKNFDPSRIISQSATWIRPKEHVIVMLNHFRQIQLEQERGHFPIDIDVRGRGSIGVHASETVSPVNCHDFAIDSLHLAGIHIGRELQGLEKVGIRSCFAMPKKHISKTSLSSKESVLVNIDFVAGISRVTINLKHEIEEFFKGKSWKIHNNSILDPNGTVASIKASINLTDSNEIEVKFFSNLNSTNESESIVIKIIVDGEVFNLDITEVARHKLVEEVKKHAKTEPFFRIPLIGTKTAIASYQGRQDNSCTLC